MIELKKNHLKAALLLAPTKDVRYYLNGVHLEFTASGDMHIVSTNGHSMFCGVVPAKDVRWTGPEKCGPLSMIIPGDTVKSAIKGARPETVVLAPILDGRYTLGDVLFAPVDGRFPDWRRDVYRNGERAPAQFEHAHLATAEAALRTWHQLPSMHPELCPNGDSAATMCGNDGTAFAIIMPIRDAAVARATPFTPAPFDAVAEAA
ncbi:hypothetical protein [Burkholderia sp. MBR-1]|uniref:hypothetical protein n=1 Tax=Burkholderia sp. MBR-1 TaxID=2732364 RepID=UPI0015EF4C65|nr:hypothetical protein [Burkholderia sp. MBR-1]QMI49722.1 hypothetical protein MBR110_30065 [Burkholderia sp. MBR-1]